MIALDNQAGAPNWPTPTTTMGATARMGIVWDMMTYGRRPRSSNRDWVKTTATLKPAAAPSAKPNAASNQVTHTSWASETITNCPLGVVLANSVTISHGSGNL